MRHTGFILALICLQSVASEEALTIAKRSEPVSVVERIDGNIKARLSEATIPASPVCSDAEFIRRTTLDITGTLPTVERVKAFLADKKSNKRAALVDELLADDDYGTYFASIWFDLLVVPSDDNRAMIDHSLEPWLAEQFNENKTWDKIVTAILTAEGKRDENPATVFWFANSDMNAKPAHVKLGDAVGKITQRFLGTQFQCAECHDHPFTPLKQADFWGTAAFFGSLSLKDAQKKMLKVDGIPGIYEKSNKGVIEIPDSKNDTAKTQFPDGTPYDVKSAGALRGIFAKWCTAPENEQFSRAMSNRMWAHFCGRGFVMPVDDFRKNNQPSHPDALAALAQDFTASGFDLKHLVRTICSTQAYQRSSETLPQNVNDESLFSHAPLKMLNASVLESALDQSLGNEFTQADLRGKARRANANGANAKKKKAANAKRAVMGSPFEQAFATSEEPDDPEYSHGVPQVLQLMNGGRLNGSPLLTSVIKASTTREGIEHLYLATLSRMPSDKEFTRMQGFVEGAATKNAGYQGVLWALLNSSEYVLNH